MLEFVFEFFLDLGVIGMMFKGVVIIGGFLYEIGIEYIVGRGF